MKRETFSGREKGGGEVCALRYAGTFYGSRGMHVQIQRGNGHGINTVKFVRGCFSSFYMASS